MAPPSSSNRSPVSALLRALAIILGLGFVGLGVYAALGLETVFAGLVFGVTGVLILLGTLYEQYRYRALDDVPPGPAWADTGERFLDPETEVPVAVFFHAKSGERRYVRLNS